MTAPGLGIVIPFHNLPSEKNGAEGGPFQRAGQLLARFFRIEPEKFGDRIVVPIDDPFLQWNDRIIGNMNILRAYLGAAFRDIAESESCLLLDQCHPRSEERRVGK